MAANIPRYVPFSNWDEWIFVKNGLYSQNRDNVTAALQVVAMWRVRGRLPHSIDSTAHLVELKLCDDSPSRGYQFANRSESELKLLYSAVVVRAVNGLVDPGQQAMYATSVLTLAEKIGLPGWIVELRHDATHNQMPSLSVFRTAAHTLLNWYFDYYWAAQMNLLENLSASCLPIALHQTGSKGVSLQNSDAVSSSSGGSGGDKLDATAYDSSPTYITEIFLPMFLSATVLADDYSRIDEGKMFDASLARTVNNQKVFWLPRLEQLFPANSSALHCVLCGLVSAFMDCCSPTDRVNHSSKEALAVCRWKCTKIELWVDIIVKSMRITSSNKVANTANNSSNSSNSKSVVSIVLSKPVYKEFILKFIEEGICGDKRIKLLSGGSKEQLQRIVSSITGMFCNSTPLPTEDISSNADAEDLQETDDFRVGVPVDSDLNGTGSVGKKRRNVDNGEYMVLESCGLQNKFAAAAAAGEGSTNYGPSKQSISKSEGGGEVDSTGSGTENSYGIRRDSSYPAWPIGALPGQYSVPPLCSIEELFR
jgi:hypothetical protein